MKKFRLGLRQKIIFPVITVSIIVYILIISTIGTELYNKSKNDAMQALTISSSEYSNYISGQLSNEIVTARNMSLAFEMSNFVDSSKLKNFDKEILVKVIKKNPALLSTWINRQLFDIVQGYENIYGRYRQVAYYDIDSNVIIKDTIINKEGTKLPGTYDKIRESNNERLVEPYFSDLKLNGKPILMTSICVPIKKNNVFVGLAGIDFSLERINKLISEITKKDKLNAGILTNEGTYIANSDSLSVGMNIIKKSSQANKKFNIISHIQNGALLSFVHTNENDSKLYYNIITPIKLDKNLLPWALQISVPERELTADAKRTLYKTILIGILGFIIMLSVLIYSTQYLIKPIIKSSIFVKKISEGDLTATVEHKNNDEIGDFIKNLNEMKERLRSMIISLKSISQIVQDAGNVLTKSLTGIKKDSELQANSSQYVTDTLQHMTNTIELNSKFATETSRIALKSVFKLNGAVKRVEDTREKLNTIDEKIEQVDEIAFNTKMISLNSAIEASHAGSYGKGFSIVAKDVRRLADKTKKISEEIRTLSMISIDKAKSSSEMIEGIVPEMKKISEMISKVADEISEQTNNSKEIGTAMNNLNIVIHNNANFTSHMAEHSQKLENASNDLINAISLFKI